MIADEAARSAASPARRAALDALTEVRRRDAYANLVLGAMFERRALSSPDRRLAIALVNGVLRARRTLDWRIDRVSRIPTKKLEPAVLDALRMAVFQMTALDRVPDHAAVAETLLLVPDRARGFCKAVLEQIRREGAGAVDPPGGNGVASVALRASLPDWVVRQWVQDFGDEAAARYAHALAHEPPGMLRACGISPGDLIAQLRDEGIDATPAPFAPLGVRVAHLDAAIASRAFAQGHAIVQGEASQIAVELVGAKPGELVLDACAAPGGKATRLAEQVGPQGRVVAADVHAGRAELIAENARRLGLANIEVRALDVAETRELADASFDRVLVDAPCTALGQAARHPELRWRLAPEDPERMSVLQLALLRAVSKSVKPGGRLVYAVCTLTAAETRDVAHAFWAQARHEGFRLADAARILEGPCRTHARDGFYLFEPTSESPEGFFAAVFERAP
ncbi:MAG: 16S rRNA (cytosine(967)-C(5))-methyltransferase RsmB [Deltaproteobacteria bacterium]|nr:16S rRNA (cytosine(967)-C(5))-methyltransferase RsmB [Deltaproteobacteria bacterium]